MKCPDGHGEMARVENIWPHEDRENWRCQTCGRGVEVTYARIGADELQKLVEFLPDEET